jgi:hypothetical protein
LLEAAEWAMIQQAKYPPLKEGQDVDESKELYPATAWPETRPFTGDHHVYSMRYELIQRYGHKGSAIARRLGFLA